MAATASIYRQPNPLLRNSFPLLLLFLFAVYSAFLDVIPGSSLLRPQFIMAILGLLAVFASGQFLKVLESRLAQVVVLFTIWFILCIPFGAWPGGSVSVFLDQWYKAALIFLMAAALLTTLPQANRLFHTIAYGVGFLSVLTLLKSGRNVEGRLILANTRYANSNDLAWTLLVGLTFVFFLYTRGTRVQKIIALLIAPPIIFALSRTGSRAGMLGTVVLFILVVLQAKRAVRMRVLVAVPLLFLITFALMPTDLRSRYVTLFGASETAEYATQSEKLRAATIGSSESRRQLLIDSLVLTAKHPLLGVGPGNFQVVQKDMAEARGDPPSWRVTHNAYTQLSSEMGVPGIVLYLAMLYFVFKTLNSITRSRSRGPTWDNLRALATSLRMAFIVFLPIAFFDSLAYSIDVPILAGITVAIGFLAQKQRAIDRSAALQPVPAAASLQPVAVGQY